MTNDIFCVGLTRTELQTLGALLYSPDGSIEVRSARQTARTAKCPGCFASLRSVQGAAPLATLVRLSQRTLRRKQSAGADHFRRRV